MQDERTRELESEEMWDFDESESRPPVKGRRVVLSVGFPRSDFQVVGEAAERQGMKVSTFVRLAAVEKASPRTADVQITFGGASGGNFAFITQLPSVTGTAFSAEKYG